MSQLKHLLIVLVANTASLSEQPELFITAGNRFTKQILWNKLIVVPPSN